MNSLLLVRRRTERQPTELRIVVEDEKPTAPHSVSKAGQVGPRHLFEYGEMPTIVEYARSHVPQQVDELLKEADGLIRGTFWLAGERYQFEDAIPWRDYFGDREQSFYLNRWQHGVTLAKAYAYTGSEKYVRRFVDLLEQWNAECSERPAGPVWESYSAGERIVNWLFAAQLLQGSPLYLEMGRPLLDRLLPTHTAHLAANLETRSIHNHLINNVRALFTYGVLCPDLEGAEEYRKWAWAILVRELDRQFDEDGMLREQSTHYHLMLTERYAEVALLARRNGQELPGAMIAKLRRMFATACLFVRPDGSLATIGDVSPEVEPGPLVGMLALGTLFGAPNAVPPTERTLWLLGAEGLDALKPGPAPSGLHVLKEAGIAIYCSPEQQLMLRCDPSGAVLRHGHNDPLGLDLWSAGHQLLLDPGCSTYDPDRWGRFFRGPFAHSTVIVDDLPPFVRSATLRSLFPASYHGTDAHLSATDQGEKIVLESGHSGYRRLPDPVAVHRAVKVSSDGTVRIRDTIETRGRHSVQLLFQLGDNEAMLNGLDGFQVYGPDGTGIAQFTVRSAAGVAIELRRGETSPTLLGWRSPAYGKRNEAKAAVCSVEANGPIEVETVIAITTAAGRASGT